MNVAELLEARAKGLRPSAPGADLRYADLRYADLSGADLGEADLRRAKLRHANLSGADLSGADLWNADLRGADLWNANLSGTGLRNAGIVALGETPSGWSCISPTPQGWRMQVGCWSGSPDDLWALIAEDDDWPEAEGDEVARRRPYLELILAHADLIMAEHPTLIDELARKWENR